MALNLPQRSSRKLTNAPVKAVVCQISFDDLGDVSRAEAQRVQQHLDGSMWPTLRATRLVTGVLTPGVPGGVSQQPPRQAWQLLGHVESESIGLRPDSFTIETQKYETWEIFKEQLTALLSAVEEVFKPSRILRVGLRYINQVSLPDTHPIGAGMIDDKLLGLLADDRFHSGITAAEQTLILEVDEELGMKCLMRHGLFPQSEDNSRMYLLDFDVNIDIAPDSSTRFESASILNYVERLHDTAWSLLTSSLDEDYVSKL